MCSLFSFRRPAEEARNLFNYLDQPSFPPRDYVTPGSPLAIVRKGLDLQRHFALVRWGFVPGWAKEILPGRPLINARSETVYEKASFKNAIRRRRCLIPADGFYEWQGDVPGKKQAWFIHQPSEELFAFGGIWEHWMCSDGSELETAAMLTAEPNALIATIHDRCPVVIIGKPAFKIFGHDDDRAAIMDCGNQGIGFCCQHCSSFKFRSIRAHPMFPNPAKGK